MAADYIQDSEIDAIVRPLAEKHGLTPVQALRLSARELAEIKHEIVVATYFSSKRLSQSRVGEYFGYEASHMRRILTKYKENEHNA